MLSAFDIFKIGIGPSSSHTVGPMRAALLFAQSLERRGLLAQVARLHVDLFGSLGATGHGHATDQGVILGLFGDAPDTVRPETVQPRLDALRRCGQLSLLGTTPIAFDRVRDIAFRGEESLPEHPNAMRFTAFAADGAVLAEGTYFSVGGGFVVEGGQAVAQTAAAAAAVPHPFTTGDELMAQCRTHGISVATLVLRNECVWRPEAEVRAGLLRIWA